MKYLPIFALFLLFACCEVTNDYHQCFRVNFSDALPIQFWLNDCETYNESVPDGVHYKCFCHPWKCDDELKIQFTDSDNGNYDLVIYNQDDMLLESIPFVVTDPEVIINGGFTGSLTGWTQTAFDSTQTRSFTAVGGRAQATIINNLIIDNNTKVIGQTVVDPLVSYNLGGTAFLNAVSNVAIGLRLYIVLYNGSSVIDEILLHTFSQTVDVFGFANYLLTPTDLVGANSIGFRFELTSSATVDDDVSLEDISLVPVNGLFVFNSSFIPNDIGVCEEFIKLEVINTGISPEEVIAKSDCLHISDIHPDSTVLYEYSNNRNFAGIIYEDLSPVQTFQIRVPAVFFHEQFPEEDEAIELSDSKIINLNGVVRAQRLFDSAHMPYYMHRKMKLIFKHQTLLTPIDDKYWTKQDAYEIEEGDRRWPLKKAKCWLTERDFVQRNVV